MSGKPSVSLLDIITSIRIQLELLEDAMRTQITLAQVQKENAELKQRLEIIEQKANKND